MKTYQPRHGPLSLADVGICFRRALRKWSDADAWLATPLPKLVADDELDGALLLRRLARQVLEDAQAIFADQTPSSQARLQYVRARASEVPVSKLARELGKSRRALVSIQMRTDRVLTELFVRKFATARAQYRATHGSTVTAGAA